MSTLRPTLLALPLLVGCKAPPEAPARLEELCTYLFQHAYDEDPEALLVGLDNLDGWLAKGDNLASTIEGYQINNLSEEAVDGLDGEDRTVGETLVGAALLSEHPHAQRAVVRATVADDWGKVAEENYDIYDRTFNRDPGCFPGRECLRLRGSSYAESKFAGIINVTTRNKIQVRWVETERGWVMLHRSWLTEPAEVSIDSVKVNAQYFLAVVMDDGRATRRLQANWIDTDYGALPVSEDFAKQQVVESMREQGEMINEWLAED